jgi:nucleoside-diphosphate-sugar epimerase
MQSILITGASGFIGSHLLNRLYKLNKYNISLLLRKDIKYLNKKINQIIIEDISKVKNFETILPKFDIVIHLAGIAHDKTVKKEDFKLINIDVTSKLVKWAIRNKVKRFIFLSSIGVNGNSSKKPFSENDFPNPKQNYAKAKFSSEKNIISNLKNNSYTKYIIVRSPLVYGNDAPGNFSLLKKWVKSSLPLPFGCINNNRKSIISINNLVSFFLLIIEHPLALNNLFLISDSKSISTKDLVNNMIGDKSHLIKNLPIPKLLIKLLLYSIGKGHLNNKLLESLEINIDKSKDILGWNPPYETYSEINKAMS